jgi:hypothetical protein
VPRLPRPGVPDRRPSGATIDVHPVVRAEHVDDRAALTHRHAIDHDTAAVYGTADHYAPDHDTADHDTADHERTTNHPSHHPAELTPDHADPAHHDGRTPDHATSHHAISLTGGHGHGEA